MTSQAMCFAMRNFLALLSVLPLERNAGKNDKLSFLFSLEEKNETPSSDTDEGVFMNETVIERRKTPLILKNEKWKACFLKNVILRMLQGKALVASRCFLGIVRQSTRVYSPAS